MRKRATLSWAPQTGWYVNLPHYTMLPGSFLPITPKLIHANGVFPDVPPPDALALNPTVVVELPDEHVDAETGQINTSKLRTLYAGSPQWDVPNLVAPGLADADT